MNSSFQVNGKSIFKEEFVTAGGIDLKEINLNETLYFAGKIVNGDVIKGECYLKKFYIFAPCKSDYTFKIIKRLLKN
jgi:hypothetical protein